MTKQIGIWALLVVGSTGWFSSSPAWGQWYSGGNGYGGAAATGYGYGAAMGYGGGGFSASDPVSNYTNAVYSGMSNLIRSQGQYNEQTARAMINYQQARNIYIDNQQKALNARQSMTRQLRAQDVADNEAAHAALARADEFIAAHQPLPLANSQLNPSTGRIDWPVALMGTDFDDLRNSLDKLFETRLKTGATSAVASEIEKKTGELKDSLRQHITMMPLKDYSEGRRFLDSMYTSAR